MTHEHAPQNIDDSEVLLDHLFGTTEELDEENRRVMMEFGLVMRPNDEEGDTRFD